MSESKPEIAEGRQWTREIIKEYRNYENPPVSPDIDIVWVISGHGTYDTESAAFPDMDPTPPEDTLFRIEDRERIAFGVDLVKKITALRINKSPQDVTQEDIKEHGPTLLYNGANHQNENLEEAIEKGEIDVPKEKIAIQKLSEEDDPKKANTKTQFEKFPQEFLDESRKIAAVTHRYHLSRVARTLNAPKVLEAQPSWQTAQVLFYAPDRTKDQLPRDATSVTKRAVDIRRNVTGEGKRIKTYTKTGELNTKKT